MAIETICSGCAKKLRVADEHAGKQARCPDCGTIYVVPTSPAAARSSFDVAPQAQSAPAVAPRWLMKLEDGREFGPVERTVLDQWYAERRIGATTQLRRENENYWQPAPNVFPALGAPKYAAPSTPGANPFAESSSYGGGYPAPAPYGAPYGAPSRYVEPHRGALILTLALVGWFTCILLGIAAWTMGSADLAKMRAGQMDPSGEGLTRAGMIIGIVETILGVLGIGLFLLVFLLALAGGMR
jgi:hypothetical protein